MQRSISTSLSSRLSLGSDLDFDDDDYELNTTRSSRSTTTTARMGEIRVRMKEVSLNSYSDGRLLEKVGRAVEEEHRKREERGSTE